MDKATYHESAILLTDIAISSPQHMNPLSLEQARVFVDVFATKGGGESIDRSLQAKLKIRRLGPLEHMQEGGIAFWITGQSVDVPLNTQHVNISVSTESRNNSGSSKIGHIETDMDSILNISLKKGTCMNKFVDIPGCNSSYILGFACVVMPGNELRLSDAHELPVADECEQQIYAWLENEGNKLPRLNKLGTFFYQRFIKTQDIPDVDKAIAYQGQILKLIPDGHLDKPSRLNNLGSSLFRRFKWLGDINDINKSTLMTESALGLTPDDQSDKPSMLNNLGSMLYYCFEWLGDFDDINKFVLMTEKAVEMTPDGHPDKPSLLINLGNLLLGRFDHLGDPEDVNKSILITENAIQLTPNGHPDKPTMLNNLGGSLLRCFERHGDLNDINKSILMEENAVQLTPDGHPDKPSRLNNLGSSLLSRFKQLGELEDINQSIMMAENAV